MNEVAKIARQPRSVLVDMAERYGMEPAAFELTVRATCSPTGRDARPLTREEFAAFLLVAKEYKLNPVTREVYAFPKKGGGIVPIVSIDGWVTLVNTHAAFDGVEFDMQHDDKNQLVACTCRIYRKDRGRPIEITEYLAECIRDTDPWRMRHRMLRHKAMIQCARYAFGFSGIYDEDEGETIAKLRNVPSERVDGPVPPKGLAAKLDSLGLSTQTHSPAADAAPGLNAGDEAAEEGLASNSSAATHKPTTDEVREWGAGTESRYGGADTVEGGEGTIRARLEKKDADDAQDKPEADEGATGADVAGDAPTADDIIPPGEMFTFFRNRQWPAELAECKTTLAVRARVDHYATTMTAFEPEQVEVLKAMAAERIGDIQAAKKAPSSDQ